jgi:hypothetical protein
MDVSDALILPAPSIGAKSLADLPAAGYAARR